MRPIREWKPLRFYRLVKRGFGGYSWNVLLLIAIGFVSGILEGVGINTLIPLFSMVTSSPGGPGAQDAITLAMRSLFRFVGVDFSLKYLLIFIASLFILRSVIALFGTLLKVRISASYEADKRRSLLESFVAADWPFLLKQRLGHIETVLMTNVHFASFVLEYTSALIIVLTNLAVYVFVAFNISWQITLMTLVLGMFFFVIIKSSFGKTRKTSRVIEAVNKEIAHFLNENLLGMKTVKASAVGRAVNAIGKKYFEDYRRIFMRIAFLRAAGDAMMQPVGVVFICILFAISYKTTNFQIGAFAAIIYLIQRIFLYFQTFQASYRALNEYAPYLQAINTLEDEMRGNVEQNGELKSFSFNRIFEFRKVEFSYSPERRTLDGVSFDVKSGETIGLIGPSGSGKTTVVDLALKLFQPMSGHITIDGVDINDIETDVWRKGIGYVSQDIFLMNDTIAANIRFHDQGITQERMVEAAKKANILEFIQSLPDGFETVIGERGTFLSGGQRQRIIIARVLARDPKILILDEATSALDNESERQIQKVIEELKGSITTIIIAHRLSTVMTADRILSLDEGRIVEEGEPQALLKDESSYLYRVYHARNGE